MSTEFNKDEKLIVDKINFIVEKISLGRISLMRDLDGVWIRSAQTAINAFNKENKTNYSERDLVGTWDMVQWAEKLGKKDPRQYSIDLWNSFPVLRYANPVQGAVELSNFLYGHKGFNIQIPAVTSRPGNTKDATIGWHDQWMPWFDSRKNLFMQKSNIINPEFKAETVKIHEPTYYFEDQIHDAEKIAAASLNTTVILVSQPWNQNYAVPVEFSGRILKSRNIPGRAKVLDAFYTLVDHATK